MTPELTDANRCCECEALIRPEYDLCDDCDSDWFGWVTSWRANLPCERCGVPISGCYECKP